MPVYFQILKQENYQDWRLPEKMKYKHIKEEELKNRIAEDYFWQYDHTKIIGNIDFCVAMYQSQKEIFEQQSLPLQKIINNPQKRKKLVVYINPPYTEHLDKKNTTSNKENIKGSISMNDWIKKYSYSTKNYFIGYLNCSSQDFLHQNYTGITTYKQNSAYKQLQINEKNLIQTGIYFSVSHCIKATWLNDRDQFLFPNDAWEMDEEFKHDCLAFTLFHSQNRISSKEEINHWIPFSESEINAREKFESNFMYLFINNKIKKEVIINLFTLQESETPYEGAMQFSAQATAVFDAGRELWKYYHKQANCNVNASLYDIREHFQGRNTNGRMNSNSNDETYTKLIEDLQEKLKILADKIIPKIYEYGFLKD